MNSSFPNRWSVSYLKFTKYVTNLIHEQKLEKRNVFHALMNARMCEQTFGRTNMHADRQTDGLTDSNIRPHARVHSNTRTHALMNIRMYDQIFRRTNMHADRQTDERTDGRTHTYALTHALSLTRTHACLQAHTIHSGSYARTDRHTHTCSYGGKHGS